VKKFIGAVPASIVVSRPNAFEGLYREGKAELEIVPQGTLAERIRAAGAGIGAFYTPTGAGTEIEKGKEKKTINGKEMILEYALRGDYALIRAHKADTMGNLVYKGVMRAFNAVMATAADIVVAEVDEIVEPGEIDPESVVTPGIFVDRIVETSKGEVKQ
jgi:3-oxoadipate CoA-transferase alpha subunit